MKLIKPSASLIWEKDMFKLIELAGRTCYKSEERITEDSAKKFVDMLMGRGHNAMIEHGTIYLTIPFKCKTEDTIYNYKFNSFSKVRALELDGVKKVYITTNYRVLVENNWLDDLQYQTEPTEHHIKRYTVKFICDRGVTHEIVRHRPASYAQESTRYCDYSKDKFDKNVTFIIPPWTAFKEGVYKSIDDLYDVDGLALVGMDMFADEWFKSCLEDEARYLKLVEHRYQPQQARAVLPNSLKTEIIMTADTAEWIHFFKMRIPPTAHPQMRELTIPLLREFNKIDSNLFPLNGFGSLE